MKIYKQTNEENKVFIHKETWQAKIQIPIMEIGKYKEADEKMKFKIWPRTAMDYVEIWPFNTYNEALTVCEESKRSADCIHWI